MFFYEENNAKCGVDHCIYIYIYKSDLSIFILIIRLSLQIYVPIERTSVVVCVCMFVAQCHFFSLSSPPPLYRLCAMFTPC